MKKLDVGENVFWLLLALIIFGSCAVSNIFSKGDDESIECVKIGGTWVTNSGFDHCERAK